MRSQGRRQAGKDSCVSHPSCIASATTGPARSLYRTELRGAADQVGQGETRSDGAWACGCPSQDQAPAREARVLPGGREAVHDLAAARAALDCVQPGRPAAVQVARSTAQLRELAGERGCAVESDPALARSQRDQHDDEIRAPGTWQRRGPHPGARNADVRGNQVAAEAVERDEAE